jgi:hypothetical protein
MHDFVEIHAARQSEILADVKWIDQGCIGGRCRAGGNDGTATESTDEWRTAFGRLRQVTRRWTQQWLICRRERP